MKILLPDGKGYKANLHGHSTDSDGEFSPERIKSFYKGKGYSIYAYTDHLYMRDRSSLCDEDFVALSGYENVLPDDADETVEFDNNEKYFSLKEGEKNTIDFKIVYY